MSEQPTEILIITLGEKATFSIFLENKLTLPRPIDLTNFDKFVVCLPLAAGGFLEITEVANANGSVADKGGTSDLLGQIDVTVGEVDTALLKEGFGQDVDIEWDNATTPNPKRKRLHKVLNVEGFNC